MVSLVNLKIFEFENLINYTRQNYGEPGFVWLEDLEIIVNPKTDIPITPQNIQLKGNSVNYTDVYYSTDDQTSQDENISATSRNYRFIDKAWWFNVAIPTANGRLTDYYTKVKMVYKGYVSNPTVSKNANKLVQFIKTFFRDRR